MDLCTIVARNELAAALWLAEVSRARQSEDRCWVLVLDDPQQVANPGGDHYALVRPEELSIAPWQRMTAGYTLSELRSAVIPWLIAHLLHERGAARVSYLAPYAGSAGTLAQIDALLDDHPVVADPPAPGVEVAGFAAGDVVDCLLDWWVERLTLHCLVAPERGYLIDRRWMDIAAGAAVLSSAVTRARSSEDTDQCPYGWGFLPDGTPLDRGARRAYRTAVRSGALTVEDIFSASGARAFLAHLRSPARYGSTHGVTRYLEGLHAERQDLQARFPDLDGDDGARYVSWAHVVGRRSAAVSAALLDGTPPIPGMQVGGYFNAVTGVGEHARQLVAALRTQGVPLTTVTVHPAVEPEDVTLGDVAAKEAGHSAPWFNLLCVNADSVQKVADELGQSFFADRYTIGFWAWEVSDLPERFLGAFGPLDEVWVGSSHVREAVAKLAPVPVLAIPQPVSLAPESASAGALEGLPGGWRFVFAFDYLSVFERKNPLGVIAAFARAFPAGSGAALIIKTLNESRDPAAHQRLRAAAASHPDVHLIERQLSAAERDGLMNAADCYVSLHRAEGFGYTLAEAMWLGKPVIATGYSGNCDYMTPQNSYLVDHRLVPIGAGSAPYPADGVWAEPDIDHAASLMRDVFEHRADASRRGQRAAADIRRSHSPEVAGQAMAARLQVVMASAPRRPTHRRRLSAEALSVAAIAERIRLGPQASTPTRFGVAQRTLRRALLRVTRPLAVHQRVVDGDLLQAIEILDASVAGLARSQAEVLHQIAAACADSDEPSRPPTEVE